MNHSNQHRLNSLFLYLIEYNIALPNSASQSNEAGIHKGEREREQKIRMRERSQKSLWEALTKVLLFVSPSVPES